MNQSDRILTNIKVVLVEPSHPGNVGAAARAMKTMGLSRMCLVAPKSFPDRQATERAAGADDVLINAEVVSSFADSIADCHYVFATSARQRSLQWPTFTPSQAGHKARHLIQSGQTIAVVFGRENSGLNNPELQMCHGHIVIPASSIYSSLNLAAAIQVICYELRINLLEIESLPELPCKEGDLGRPITVKELDGYLNHLESTLRSVQFLNPTQPRKLMSRLRRLYQRAELDDIELDILRGILSATQKSIRKEEKTYV